MSKDPAFLFYSSDFLNGVADLTYEERGQFITMLCLQHQKGYLTDKTIRLSVGSVLVDVLSKFRKTKDGHYVNDRLLEEIEKRNKFTESRRNNGMKGGRPSNNEKKSKPLAKPYGYATDNHMEDENENENKDINRVEYPWKNEKFITTWEAWKKYKAKEFGFRYKSPSTEKAALTELNKIATDDETAIEIINKSIANGWKGFWELKRNGNRKDFTEFANSQLRANDPDYKNY